MYERSLMANIQKIKVLLEVTKSDTKFVNINFISIRVLNEKTENYLE